MSDKYDPIHTRPVWTHQTIASTTRHQSQTMADQDTPPATSTAEGLISKEQLTGIVYSIPCKDCPKTYVGQSAQSLACRIKEHQQAVWNGNINSLAVAEHVWQEQHNIDRPAAMILDSNHYLYSRLILESWHIYQQPDPMNKERGPLPPVYCSLMKKYCSD